MAHPNTKAFLSNVTTKENRTKAVVQAGGNPPSLAGGGARKVKPSSKRKTL